MYEEEAPQVSIPKVGSLIEGQCEHNCGKSYPYSVSAPPDTLARDDTVIRKLSQFWPDGPGNFYTVNNHVYLLSREIRSQLVEVSGFCDGVNPF